MMTWAEKGCFFKKKERVAQMLPPQPLCSGFCSSVELETAAWLAKEGGERL